jgi:glycogen operon protein
MMTAANSATPEQKAEHERPPRIGVPYPQGATWDGKGVNFALFSEESEAVELCLFDSPDAMRESREIA